ncbi:MAG: PAS domain S-box protein [Candidatus Cloacimonetes bacterium]|jgi:PAS domain S-box-containing protein|nr:PAS domain S-box protein [Candidatus Cloacimonadota bacterium]
MKDSLKTNKQLLETIDALKANITRLEKTETKNKRVEEKLKESEEKYRAIFESLQDVYYRTDMRGRLTIISPSVLVKAGYNTKELIGHHVSDFYHNPSDRKIFETKLKESGTIDDYELQLEAKDGKVIEVSISSKIIYGKNGRPSGIDGIMRDVTERKQAKEALQSSEERLKLLFDAAPDAYYLNDLKGNFVDANKAAEDMLGYTKNEIAGQNLLKLKIISPKQIVKATRLLAINALGKGTGPDEFILNKKDGTTVDTEIRTFPVKIDDKTVVLGIARDITERKRAEEALSISENNLRALFRSMKDIVLEIDYDGRYVNIAPTSPNLLYKPSKEMIGKTLHEIFPKSEADNFLKFIRKSLEINESITMEYPLTIKGKTVWFEGRASHKTKNTVLYIAHDITERKKNEAALKESEEKYRNLVERANDGICIIMDGIVTFTNPRLLELWGGTNEEIIGSPFTNFIHPDELNKLVEYYKKRLKGEKTPSIYESVLLHKSGSKVYVELSAGIITFKGKPADLIIIRDITERKQTEEALKDSEQLNKAVIDHSPIGISVRDKKGSLLLSNNAWQNLWGFSEKEINRYKESREKLVFNEKDSYLGEHLNKIKEIYETGGEYYIREIKLSHSKKNKAEWISQYFYSIMDEKGAVQRVVVLTVDITKRKKAEDTLSVQRQRLSDILEGTNAGTWDWHVQTGEVIFNERWAEIIGYTLKDLKPININTWMDNVHPDDLPNASLLLDRHFNRESDYYDVEFRQPHKDGRWIWVNARGKVIEWADNGKPLRMSGTHLDITERKEAEEQIARDLKIKNSLLQEIYHRTKNNMSVISSMLTMQSRNTENEFVKTTFKEMINKIKAMSLVHQKLYQVKDLSRINLKEYIEDLIHQLRLSYSFGATLVSLKFEMDEVFTLIDTAVPLGLVLNELISNIFKHAFPTEIKGEIRIHLFKEANDVINLHLSDNGVGIPLNMDLRKEGSMGLGTMFSLIEYQLKGEVTYSVENGLKWCIKFKNDLNRVRV